MKGQILECMLRMRHKHSKGCNTLFLVLVSPQIFIKSDAKVLEEINEIYM